MTPTTIAKRSGFISDQEKNDRTEELTGEELDGFRWNQPSTSAPSS